MPHLVEGQPARLDLGESLPCRIIGFSGPDVVLSLEAQPEEPPQAGDPAYLLLETEGRMQAVRGELGAPAGDEVVLRLTDDIRLGQRRVFSRAPISLPARVRSGGKEWTTATRDVSAGGVSVVREGIEPGDDPLEVRIQVAQHEVVARAVAVRVGAADLGLRFEEIDKDDRLLLASLTLAYHRRR
ncbi:MAG TPA: PilZ domain-containing protein [Solirubrobacteraceae bacterium]|nr:PilZ domain-containing protein [Solirubrobacteraceae bacterium]